MKMISIDPGTRTIGICYWQLDKNLDIINITSETLIIDDNIVLEQRLNIIYNLFYKIFEIYKPFQVVHEDAFMNRFRPNAYGPIYTTIYLIRNAYINQYGYYGIFSYPPKSIKAVINTGDANKNDMLMGVKKIEELKRFITDNMSEHEIDAIAIGYTHLLNVRNMVELLMF